jgi:Fe-S-cluster containining protein
MTLQQPENTEIITEYRDRKYFFDDGILFECSQCGKCCNGAPGIIIVLENEIGSIADFLEIERQVFIERCLYPYSDNFSIREDDTGRCIFFENGCSIYPVRPLQCRTFPFWFTNLRSETEWVRVLKSCPGTGKGKLYSKEEILDIVMATFSLYKPFCHALGLDDSSP